MTRSLVGHILSGVRMRSWTYVNGDAKGRTFYLWLPTWTINVSVVRKGKR